MPGLTPQPSDELYRRIAALEQRARNVATIKRNTPHNAKVTGLATAQTISATSSTTVSFPYVVYDNPSGAWDTGTNEFTVPSSGLYLVVANIPLDTGASQDVTLSFSQTLGGVTNGNKVVQQSAAGRYVQLTTVTPLLVDETWQLWIYMTSGGDIGYPRCLTIQRLSDLPENADQPT